MMWPSRGDEEARADRGLAGLALEHGADLDQLRARLLVDLARRERDRRASALPVRRRRPAPAGRRRRRGAAAAGPTPTLRPAPARLDGPAPDANSHRDDSTGRAWHQRRARKPRCYSRRTPRARAPAQETTGDIACNAAACIRAALAGPAASSASAADRPRPGAREAEADDRRRRQEPAVLPAADDRRAARLLQGRRARRHDRRFRRRLARAAGAGRRQRRRGLGRVRAHHQHAGQGPAPARLRAAGARAADRARRQPEDDAELQDGGRPEGQEDRRHRAGHRRPTWWPTSCSPRPA